MNIIESSPIEIGEVLGHGAFSYVKTGKTKGLMESKKLAIKIY